MPILRHFWTMIGAAGLIALAGLTVLAPGSASAQSGLIANVRVEGNQRVEAETIRSYMAVGPGEPGDAAAVDRSLKQLFATGLFADVTIRREGDDLVVRVIENPIINQLAFEGNNRIEDEELEAEVQLRPRVVYTRAKVQADVARILEIYRRSGRFAATVEPKVIRQEQNRVDLIFEIDEGARTKVRRISFVGNERFSDAELRDVILTKESAWYRFFTEDDTYDPDRLSFDRELLRRFYLSKGYADVAIVAATADLTADRGDFFITFTVEEGDRYDFGTVRVKSAVPDLRSTDLHPYVRTFTGERYNADLIEDTIQDMVDAIGDLGYAFVDVVPRLNRDTEARIIDITYDVTPGPRVYVERINVEGNVRTLDRVVRREFKIAEGDAFSTAKLRRSEQRIRNLDFFDTVTVTTEEGSAPDQAVVNVEVTEKSTGELTFSAGFSTLDGALGGILIRERNLLGKGQDLSLETTLSFRRQDVDLSFTEPAFLGRDELSAGFDVFNTRRNRQRDSSFDQNALGFALRMGYPLMERVTHSVRYSLRRDRVSDVDPSASRFVREQEGSAVTSLVGHEITFDALDNRVFPTEGLLVRFSQDFAGLGGGVHYLRHQLVTTGYHAFADDWIGSLTLRQGHIFGIFGDDVRINDRFFVGGQNVRGFDTTGIGPRDQRTLDSLGSKAFWTASAELTYPVGLPRELGVLGRAFVDVGSAWSTDASGPGVLDSEDPRVSVGVGISYDSPIGPLRADFAKAIVKEDFDETEFFRFSFGTRF
ncbi:MAG: outer membrane protein assembly factor BamA [Alphaproteobacteria bacterium]